MRITIMTGPWHSTPPVPCGAVERRWFYVAQEFAKAGHRVTFIARGHEVLPKHEHIAGVDVWRRGAYRITKNTVWNLIQDLSYTLSVLTLLPRGDVFVTNNVWMPMLASRLRLWGRVVQNVARMPKGQMKWYLRCGRLSAVSQAIADTIVKQCPAASPLVAVIPNPIDVDVFKPNPNASPILGRLLYTGRVNPEKGLEILIDAVRLLRESHPEIHLDIVGPQDVGGGGGGADYIASLHARAQGLPIRILPPEFDRSRLADIYRAAAVYVYPSIAEKGESFGVAPVEAMACGVPVIVSGLECFNEFMIPETTGLVFDHRVPEPHVPLASQIGRLLYDKPLARSIAQAGAKRAEQFSYKSIASRYIADWNQMLAGMPGMVASLPWPPVESEVR